MPAGDMDGPGGPQSGSDWARRRRSRPQPAGLSPWQIDRQRSGGYDGVKNDVKINYGGSATDRRDGVYERLGWGYDPSTGKFMSRETWDRKYGDPGGSPGRPSTGGYGGGYSSGGGGGHIDPNKTFDPYAQAVLAQLEKQQGAPAWASKIDQFVNNDIDAAKAAWGNVPAAEANPYSDMDVAYAEQLAPDMAALLASQGIDPAVYGAQVAGANAGLNAAGSNWENLRRSNAANVDASNAAFNNDVGVMRANSVSNLEAQRAALQMAAAQQEESRKQKTIEAIIALLGQGYGAGADVSKIDLGGWA